MNPITIKQPKSANQEFSIVTTRPAPVEAPVETEVGDVEVTAAGPVTVLVIAPGRTQVHVCAEGQLVGPAVPTHVVVWPVHVLIGQVVRVWSMVIVSPFAFRLPVSYANNEMDLKICSRCIEMPQI